MYYVKCQSETEAKLGFHRQEVSAIIAAAEAQSCIDNNGIKNTVIERGELAKTNCRDLILEVGRRCNLKCEHCLRGEAQNVTMSFETAKTAIDQFDSIGTITFTGGEPALYGKEISDIVDYIIATDVPVGSFYVATNGVHLDWALMNALMRLYAHCDVKEMCSLDISNDHFHQSDMSYSSLNYDIYKAFSFTQLRGDIAEVLLINEGRAYENGYGGRYLSYDSAFYYDEWDNEIQQKEMDVEMVYINALGGVLPDCDFSYQSQDEMNPYTIVDITSGKITMQKIIKTYNKEENDG